MKTLTIHDTHSQLAAILAEIEQRGEWFVICRDNVPIADIIPHRRVNRLAPHPVISRIAIKYDPTESLNHEEWPEDEA